MEKENLEMENLQFCDVFFGGFNIFFFPEYMECEEQIIHKERFHCGFTLKESWRPVGNINSLPFVRSFSLNNSLISLFNAVQLRDL